MIWLPAVQCFGSGFTDSGSGSSTLGWIPIRIQGFDDQKLKKKLQLKKKFHIFFIKTAIYLSLGLHKGRPIYRRSLPPSKEYIQGVKTWYFLTLSYFCGSFLSSWIRIRNTAAAPSTPPPPGGWGMGGVAELGNGRKGFRIGGGGCGVGSLREGCRVQDWGCGGRVAELWRTSLPSLPRERRSTLLVRL